MLNLSVLLWDVHQQAVVSDGVDDGVGHTLRVSLRVSFFEVQTLEQNCGQLLGPLGCLEEPHGGQKSLFHPVRSESRPGASQNNTHPVLAVDMLSQFFQFFVTGYRSTRVRPSLHGDGCSEEAVHHDVGVTPDG